jgi:hypothetical protein
MGYNARYLADVDTGWPIFGDKYVLDTIRDFIEQCAASEMYVTHRLATVKYHPFCEKWMGVEVANKAPGVGQTSSEPADVLRVTKSEATELQEIGELIKATMLAEAEGIYTFIAKDKRFAVSKLLNDVPSLMSPGTYSSLPEIAKLDFREAGRCIAFESCTAAAFHLMRGTEDTLRWFYCELVKRNRVQLMWGPMVTHLRKRRTPPPAVILDNLNSLRVNFRNPTQHPEKVYDIEEVQDLMFLSLDVINRMVRFIRTKG